MSQIGRATSKPPGVSHFTDDEVLDIFGNVFEDARVLADAKRAKGSFSFNINGSVASLNGEFPAQLLTEIHDSLKPTPLWQTVAFTVVLGLTLLAPFMVLNMERKTNGFRGNSCTSQAPIWTTG